MTKWCFSTHLNNTITLSHCSGCWLELKQFQQMSTKKWVWLKLVTETWSLSSTAMTGGVTNCATKGSLCSPWHCSASNVESVHHLFESGGSKPLWLEKSKVTSRDEGFITHKKELMIVFLKCSENNYLWILFNNSPNQ